MKIICTLSNIEYALPEFSRGPNTSSTSPHPIFSWEPKQLLNQAGRWSRNELNPTERRLLFLALLKATDLCEWKSPAVPNDLTVQKNMEALMKVLSWRLTYGNKIALPVMMIRYPENHMLDNIANWIKTWNERKDQYLNGYKTVFRKEELTKQEQILERLIKSTHKKSQDYAGQLADWFMTAADVPLGLKDYWKSLFKLRGYEIYNARKIDLKELLDHAQEHLGEHHGSIYGNAVMKHLRTLYLKNKMGLKMELSGDFNALMNGPKGAKFIFEDTVDELPEVTENMIANAKLAPESKPLQSEIGSKYPTKLDYLRALAYWGQKQTVDASRQALESSAQEHIVQAELDLQDNAIDEEFSHLDDEDDLQEELGLNNPNDIDKDS